MGRRRVSIRIRLKEKGAVSPAAAFAVLVLVLAAALVAFAVFEKDDTGGRPAPSPAGTPTDEDLSLTDAEAIARFKELDALRIRAYQEADSSLLKGVFVDGSPPSRIAVREIRRLDSDGLRSESVFSTRELRVRSNNENAIEISQIVLIQPRLVNREGQTVNSSRRNPVRQRIIWTLTPAGGNWLIADGLVVGAKELGQ